MVYAELFAYLCIILGDNYIFYQIFLFRNISDRGVGAKLSTYLISIRVICTLILVLLEPPTKWSFVLFQFEVSR